MCVNGMMRERRYDTGVLLVRTEFEGDKTVVIVLLWPCLSVTYLFFCNLCASGCPGVWGCVCMLVCPYVGACVRECVCVCVCVCVFVFMFVYVCNTVEGRRGFSLIF